MGYEDEAYHARMRAHEEALERRAGGIPTTVTEEPARAVTPPPGQPKRIKAAPRPHHWTFRAVLWSVIQTGICLWTLSIILRTVLPQWREQPLVGVVAIVVSLLCLAQLFLRLFRWR